MQLYTSIIAKHSVARHDAISGRTISRTSEARHDASSARTISSLERANTLEDFIKEMMSHL
eukprot:5760535-Pyramimonas_sp.AAC.1